MSLTEQQIKDLKPGDVVTVRLTYRHDATEYGGDTFSACHAANSVGMIYYTPYADIISVEPRPIQVGDKVKLSDSSDIAYEVLVIRDDEAVTYRDGYGMYVNYITSLIRVDG